MSEQQLSPVALRVAAGLVALLVVGVVGAGLTIGSDASGGSDGSGTVAASSSPTRPPRTGPLALVPVDAPAAESGECVKLTAALPDELPNAGGTLRRLPLAAPAPTAAAAWGAETGEPVVLRCGLARPAELTPTSSLRAIDKVQWLVVEGDGASTWYAVDRGAYLALTVPADTGTGPLQDLSAIVAGTLEPVPIRTR